MAHSEAERLQCRLSEADLLFLIESDTFKSVTVINQARVKCEIYHYEEGQEGGGGQSTHQKKNQQTMAVTF